MDELGMKMYLCFSFQITPVIIVFSSNVCQSGPFNSYMGIEAWDYQKIFPVLYGNYHSEAILNVSEAKCHSKSP